MHPTLLAATVVVGLAAVLCTSTALGAEDVATSARPAPTSPTLPTTLRPCPSAAFASRSLLHGLRDHGNLDRMERALLRLRASLGIEGNEDDDVPPCLSLNSGWWTYELCWGRYLRQFHVEPATGVVSAEHFLGLGPVAMRSKLRKLDRDPVLSRVVLYAGGTKIRLVERIKELRAVAATDDKEVAEEDQPEGDLLQCSTYLEALDNQRRNTAHLLAARAHAAAMAKQLHDEQVKAKQRDEGPVREGLPPTPPEAKDAPVVGLVDPKAFDTAPRDSAPPAVLPAMRYGKGTLCDQTMEPRSTLIVLSCEKETEFYVSFNVTEPVPCRYVAYVYGAAVCNILQGVPLAAAPRAGAKPAPQDHRSQIPLKLDEAQGTLSSAPAAATDATSADGSTTDRVSATPSRYRRGHTTPEAGKTNAVAPRVDGDDEDDEDEDDERDPPYEGALILTL